MDKKTFLMGDDLIAVVRELVQLSIVTGTNVVDHFRRIEIEVDEETQKLIPTEDYIEKYNETISILLDKAEKAMKALEETEHESSEHDGATKDTN